MSSSDELWGWPRGSLSHPWVNMTRHPLAIWQRDNQIPMQIEIFYASSSRERVAHRSVLRRHEMNRTSLTRWRLTEWPSNHILRSIIYLQACRYFKNALGNHGWGQCQFNTNRFNLFLYDFFQQGLLYVTARSGIMMSRKLCPWKNRNMIYGEKNKPKK